MKTDICIGIDNHQSDFIRVVCLDAGAVEAPWPIELRSFTNVNDFNDYWNDLLSRYGSVYVGVEFSGEDHFEVLEWLEFQEVAAEYFSPSHYTFGKEILRHKVPQGFHGAYQLALCRLYRANAASISSILASDVAKLEQELGSLTTRLEALSTALSPKATNYCPF